MRAFVLTQEYSDRSAFNICGVTQNMTVALAWVQSGDENHVYELAIDVILPAARGAKRWNEFTAPDRIREQGDEHERRATGPGTAVEE